MDSDTLSFLLFLMALWWIIAAIAVAKAAGARGRSQVKWFGMAAFVSPLLSAILLLAYPIQSAEVDENATGDSQANIDANRIYSRL